MEEKMTALAGIWGRAREEFQELEASTEPPAKDMEPEHLFCLAYTFGVAFGLALSTVRPDFVEKFAPAFEKRGWLREHRRERG